MSPREVVLLQLEYGQVEYKNFVTNLRYLQNALKALHKKADIDDLVLAQYWQLHSIDMDNPNFSYLVGTVAQCNACSRLMWTMANIQDTSPSTSK
jgi:hypothetical protein